MNTFSIAIKYLKDIDLSFWDITKTPDQQTDMQHIIKVCYDRFEQDKDNIVSNETYRATVFEVALYHLIDLAHNRTSCFLIACQICSNNNIIFSYDNYELRGAYPKVMWDEWDKYCAEQNHQPYYLAGELGADIFMVAYEYTFNPEPPRFFIKAKKVITKLFFAPYMALSSIVLTCFWYLCMLTVGIMETERIYTKILRSDEQFKSTLQLTTSILIWILTILSLIHFV